MKQYSQRAACNDGSRHAAYGAPEKVPTTVPAGSGAEATAQRPPGALVTKREYTALTNEEFVAMGGRKKRVHKGPSSAPAGPMWIAGKPSPFGASTSS